MLEASGHAADVVTSTQPKSESDSPVFRGYKPGSAPASYPPSMRGQVPDAALPKGTMAGPAGGATPTTASYGEEIARWYTMSAAERTAVQREFQRAGVYGDTESSKVPFGDANDSEGFAAWEQAVTKARHLYFLGQNVTTEDVVSSLPEATSANESRDQNAQLSRWYQMTPGEREIIQTKMFVAGMYGEIDANQVPYGQPDATGFSLWAKLVQQSMASAAAGKPASPESFLEAQASFALANPKQDKVTVSSAASIAQNVDSMAQKVLGRKASPAEQRVLIAAFHAQERSYQTQKSGTVTTPDLAATAEQQLRASNPAEAGAHDVAGVFSNFLSMLGGVR